MHQPGIALDLPVIIKAHADGDRRMVEVEASNERTDSEGDVILQAALLAAAPSFIARGHLDIDHISEIGGELGIRNPQSWIVGRPTEVKDIGNGRTSVVGELTKADRAEALWKSLKGETASGKPWRASIYGFPTNDGLVDARLQKCAEFPSATRFVVKAINWTSLAFTQNPINDAITGSARLVSAKALMKSFVNRNAILAGEAVAKSPADCLPSNPEASPYYLTPRNRAELLGHYYGIMEKGLSPYAGGPGNRSVFAFKMHFEYLCCIPEWEADILANALAHLIKRDSRA